MNALITVVIPVYNAEKSIGVCINSLLQQTYENIQIVIIDDGSADGSFAVCNSYAQKDSRIKLVRQDNAGEGAARNKGLEEADGAYLCFVDADDTVNENFVESLYGNLEQYKADLSICGYSEWKKEELLNSTAGAILKLSQNKAMEYLLREEYFRGYVWNKLFSLQVIRDNGLLFDKTLAVWTDVAFVFHYLTFCERIIYDPTPKYNYMYMESSVSHSANHVLGVTKSYSAVRAQKQIELLIPKEYTNVIRQLKIRYVQSALAVIRNIGYQKNVDDTIYRECLGIIKANAAVINNDLSRKERNLVLLCRYAPGILIMLYRIKAR